MSSRKNMMARAVLIIAALLLAVWFVPGAAFAEDDEDVKLVRHNPYEHAAVSRITQEYGPSTVYLHCEWEEDLPPLVPKSACELCKWPLITMVVPAASYDGTPKEPEWVVQEMKDYPFIKTVFEFPYDYAEWDGKFIYTGADGTVEYGPTDKAPIGEGTYSVYATIKIPTARTLTFDGKFVLRSKFTILPSAYDLSYDPNVPDNASTKASGAMPVQHFNSTVDTRQLVPNYFILPGYSFDSWNTKPDGSGNRYENNAFAKNISGGRENVTLYAQWKPKSYTITYNSGNAEGEDVTEKAFFDQPQKLRSIEEMGWTYENHGFLGWSKVGYSMILGDQEEVVNLGGSPEGYYNDPPDAELTAEWVGNGAIVVAVTKDGVPQQVEQKEGKELFSLKKDSGETFTMSATYEDGRYVFDPSQATHGGTTGALPPGDYELTLDAKGYPEATTEISYSGEKPVSTVFDYYTVSLEPDPAYNDFHKVEMTGVTPDANGRYETLVLDDSEVEIKTTRIADGYHFDGYSAAGACPEWDGDNMKRNQTVKVTGHAEIMAHVEANKYTVHFDANTKAPVLGKMEDQDMVYDVLQELFGNVFQRSNAVFTGWNTKSDGSGKAYKDRERVKNLTAKDGDKVTLYAQWKEDPVKTALLTFDLTGGTLDGMTGKVSVREIIGNTITIPKAPKRERYYFLYWKGADNKVYEPGREYMVTGDQTFTAVWQPWEDCPEDKVSGKLLTKAAAKGKNRLAISWSKVKGASGYDIFFARCNHDNKKIATKSVKTIKGNKTFKWTKSGLKKGTAYKFYVKAYVIRDGKKTYISTSPVMHAYTGGGNKKYTNAKSVTVKKKEVSLKKGKTYKIKAKVNKVKKNKKLMPKSHAPTLRYMTSNSKIASVNSGGKITAKGSGTCYIYVYAHNGVSKQVKVTVK